MYAAAVMVLSMSVLGASPHKADSGISSPADSGASSPADAGVSGPADLGTAPDTGYAIPPPDELDILTSKASKANVLILVDNSSGLNGNPKPASRCPWYANKYLGGTGGDMKAYQQLQAVLAGCESPEDGVLGKWFSTVNFGLAQIDATYLLRAQFQSPLGTLTAETLALAPQTKVFIVDGFREAARSFNDFFTNSNNNGCAQNFIIWVAGGNDNGPAVNYDAECAGYVERITTGPEATRYLSSGGTTDMLCNVTGTQNIETWVIGISPTGSGVTRLQSMALNGNGDYYLGNDYDQISLAFDKILSNIVARANVSFTAATVQSDGLFFQNFLYSIAFSPRRSGPWAGNAKKHCIFPQRLADNSYDPTDEKCVFTYDATEKALYTNPTTTDVWSGAKSQDAKIGGAGQLVSDSSGLNMGPPKGTPAAPYWPRKVFTWRPDTSAYVAVNPSSGWSDQDGWVSADERAKLLNLLHGYSYDKVAGTSDPVMVSDWPFGDPIHANSMLFKYGKSCESGAGVCFLVMGTNDGQIRFIDAYNGKETSALIPAELWQPNNTAAHALSRIMSQPTLEVMHRYYVDGGIRKLHIDSNGDGFINSTETAYLVVSLGRGGSATYLIPMTKFDGVPTVTNNPIAPLVNTPGSPFQELREAWGGPWLGYTQLNGTKHKVAIFPSGHIGELDRPGTVVPTTVTGPATFDAPSAPQSVVCATAFGSLDCEYYNAAGYTDALIDDTAGPFEVPNAIAYRLVFSSFDLDPNDVFFLQDGLGRRAVALTGGGVAHASHASWSAGLTSMTTPWLFDSRVSWRLSTNGVATTNKGYKIARVEYLTRTPGAQVEHYPSVFMVDLDRWNGSVRKPFAGSTSGDGVLVQFARSCAGSSSSRICVDASQESDLKFMTCPIGADVAVYTTNEDASAIYWGDECGQIFTARMVQDGNSTSFRVRRLMSLNNPSIPLDSQTSPVGFSKDFRKIFRKLDLVPSTCPGQRLVGVYFGSGNLQRPTAFDDLQNPGLNNGRDVVGVFWDDGNVSNKFVEADLTDVTNVISANPVELFANGKNGWYWNLAPGERMLRDPIVIQGVTYFKTHHPISQANVCAAGSGQEKIYAVNNCTSKAMSDGDSSGTVGDSAADRAAWTAPGDIGGDPLLMVPMDEGAFITHGDLNTRQKAVVGTQKKGPPFRLFNWRVPRLR